jgi:hypothetical protein
VKHLRNAFTVLVSIPVLLIAILLMVINRIDPGDTEAED